MLERTEEGTTGENAFVLPIIRVNYVTSNGQGINLKCLSFVEKKTETTAAAWDVSINVFMINCDFLLLFTVGKKMLTFGLSCSFTGQQSQLKLLKLAQTLVEKRSGQWLRSLQDGVNGNSKPTSLIKSECYSF